MKVSDGRGWFAYVIWLVNAFGLSIEMKINADLVLKVKKVTNIRFRKKKGGCRQVELCVPGSKSNSERSIKIISYFDNLPKNRKKGNTDEMKSSI